MKIMFLKGQKNASTVNSLLFLACQLANNQILREFESAPSSPEKDRMFPSISSAFCVCVSRNLENGARLSCLVCLA